MQQTSGARQSGKLGCAAVVGAGSAGLAAAWALVQNGWDVHVFERHPQPGGLCRSFTFGDFVFDLGPHRFHTYHPRARDFLLSFGDDWHKEVGRVSGAYMWGKYLEWPLPGSALLRMPPAILVRSTLELLRKKKGRGGDSFEDYIVSRYGRTLYDVFFQPYTSKFLKLDGAQVHSEWATGSIQKAIISEATDAPSIVQLVRNAFMPARRAQTLWYPVGGGIQVFYDMLAERLDGAGADLHWEQRITSATPVGDGYELVGDTGTIGTFDAVVWTAPPDGLAACTEDRAPAYEYLNTVFYFLGVDEPARQPWQWCYFGGPAESYVRISCPQMFSPSCAPQGATGLCAEVTAANWDDPVWREPEKLAPALISDLRRTGYVSPDARVDLLGLERVAGTYPVYGVDSLTATRQWIDGIKKGNPDLALLGRQACFWYNNADESMDQALEWADGFLAR